MRQETMLCIIAVFALFGMFAFPWLFPHRIILIPPALEEAAFVRPAYAFPSVVTLKPGPVHLDDAARTTISEEDFVTAISLELFQANYTLEQKNKSAFIHIQTSDKDVALSLDTQMLDVLSRFYAPEQNLSINFSEQPYGAQHFFSTAPSAVPDAVKEQVQETLQQAGINRRALIQGVLALPKEEQTLGWYFLANLKDQGFYYSDGSFIPDAAVMDSQTLYENVHYTYLAWNYFPWAQSLTLSDIVTYVLPHRAEKEPLQRWRKQFFEALAPALENVTDPYEAGQFLVNISQRLMVYNGKTFWEDQGPLTLLETHQGRSGEMAVLSTALFGAVGIPAGEMVMYWWPKEEGNHGFNYALIPLEGNQLFLIQFDQSEWNNSAIGIRTAKSYMTTPFDTAHDVTTLVASAGDITVQISRPWADAYLNVFNSGGWVTLMAEESDASGSVTFSDVGNERNYLFTVSYDPLYYPDDDPELLALPPFIAEKSTSKLTFLMLEKPNILKEEYPEERLMLSDLEPLQEYHLYAYSTEGFVRIEDFFASNRGTHLLHYGMQGRLYFLKNETEESAGAYERPFLITNGTIEFY